MIALLPEPGSWKDQPLRVLVDMLGIGPIRLAAIVAVFIFTAAPVLLLPLFIEHVIATLSDPASASLMLIGWPALALIALQLGNIPARPIRSCPERPVLCSVYPERPWWSKKEPAREEKL